MTRPSVLLLAVFIGLAPLITAHARTSPPPVAQNGAVRLKDIGRFLGWQDNVLIGYGLVTGLSGSGDSPRSTVTRQALSNVLSRLGANIPAGDLQSRNVAAVVVTATLPSSANVGDRIDATVTSISDARSLVGGVLLMTPLMAADHHVYALAQGPLVIGGYSFRDDVNLRQKNHPTTGVVAGGATVETPVQSNLVSSDGYITFILTNADFTTAQRVADTLNLKLGATVASVSSAEAVQIATSALGGDISRLVATIESIQVIPDDMARVIINERSGTVVAGSAVKISSVVIAQGDIKVSVSADDSIAIDRTEQARGDFTPDAGRNRRTLIVSNGKLEVSDHSNDAAIAFPNTTVADLVRGLTKVKVGTRDMIAILQAIKAAGALHADIIVQ